ncbi:MAG: NAD(P)/FAD-dependent oxidoreductase [Proteobacteria bacterium]|nr:NAD(P)/FAD-dependent oxidoreductase [Pseudomonadota bacterium]
MDKREYDAIIIGGGPNGLTTAAYLIKAGAKVLVIEKRREMGGGAASDNSGGFRYQPHATYMVMGELMPAYKDFDMAADGVKFVTPEVQAALITKDGPLVFYQDPEKTAQSISTFSKDDAKSFLALHEEMKAIFDEILFPATYTYAVPALDQFAMFEKANMPIANRFGELAEMNFLQIVDQFGFGEPTKTLLLYLATMWGVPFESGLGFLFPLFVYRMLNSGICRGGTHRAIGALIGITHAGGDVVEGMAPEKIIMENGRAVGVKMEDGREFWGKTIISSLNPEQTFKELVGEENCTDDLNFYVNEWKWEYYSMLNFNIALKEPVEYKAAKDNPDVNKALTCVLGLDNFEDLNAGFKKMDNGEISLHAHASPLSLYSPGLAPKGYHTAKLETLAPFDLDGDAANWDAREKEITEKFMDMWASYSTNFKSAYMDVHTSTTSPLDVERRFATMKRGSFKHGAYTAFQLGSNRPNPLCSSYRTPIPGLYVNGASTYPGGMILGACGYVAASAIVEDLGMGKWWSDPDCVIQAREKGLLP